MLDRDDERRERAESAFAEFLSLGREGEGDFEAFCLAHAELKDELRSLYEDWTRIRKLIGRTSPPSLSEQLSATHGFDVENGVTLDPPERPSSAVVERLNEHRPQGTRYEVHDEIARGGMGVILKLWDQDLRRNLAMKALMPRHGKDKGRERGLARFLEEAQITGQLGHPGIVPVHDLGIDAVGRVFFTMPLVQGRDFKDAIRLTREGREGWTRGRALRVLLKVCEAVAYAHSRKVIHRDIKPANVMVGRFGETYVMDWGLARVLGREDRRDIRIRPDSATTAIETDRSQAREASDASPLITMDGAVIGTPSYMPPEQARGEVDDLDGRADVYSIGAMLYHLLSHQMPYCPKGAFVSPRTVLSARLNGPPPPILDLAPEAPPALVGICEKAMSDDRDDRYATPLELAEDIERYLSDRPVSAHEAGLAHQLALAYRRNRTVVNTAAIAAAVLLAFATLFLAERRRAGQRRFDVMAAHALPAQADELFPTLPSTIPAMDAWLARADDLLRREGRWEGEAPSDDADAVRASMAALHDLRPTVEARLDFARRMEDPAYLDRERDWAEAVAAIEASELYGGLRLEPADVLAPLGPDPQTGLWEFWNVLSGERPSRDPETGSLALSEEDGLVFVLLPGRTFLMGSPEDEESRSTNESQREVSVEPFFAGKHEVTQSQWSRIFASNPSGYPAGLRIPGLFNPLNRETTVSALHPVETVDWHQASELARRLGVELLAEEQWEYACRAGSTTAWIWGDEQTSLEGRLNLADQSAGAFASGAPVPWDDGFTVHAPVGSYDPNPFGLHDMDGNVAEWCANWYEPDWSGPERRKIQRGGTFMSAPEHCRSAQRVYGRPTERNFSRGVRLGAPARRAD